MNNSHFKSNEDDEQGKYKTRVSGYVRYELWDGYESMTKTNVCLMYIVYENRSGDDCVGGAKPNDGLVGHCDFFYKSNVGKVMRKRLSHVSKPFCVMMLVLCYNFQQCGLWTNRVTLIIINFFYVDTFE